MENAKQCPYCAEDIKPEAVICRYCRTDLLASAKEKTGRYVRVRVKTRDQVYVGDLFVPDHLQRVSDVLNDTKGFIMLVNSVEENKIRDVPVGFIAINKVHAEWIRLVEGHKPAEGPNFMVRSSP